jgi:gas vesicle protein
MSQEDNFFGGFLVGALVGGVVGGVLGTLVAPRLSRQDALESEKKFSRLDGRKGDKRQPPTEQSIEASRRGLEDKIAQLNEAIDDVRLKLGGVNGGGARVESSERVKGDG